MSNNYIESVADDYGDTVKLIKDLEEKKEKLREELLTFVHDVPVTGLRWTVSKSESTMTGFDQRAAKEFLGEKAREFERKTRQTKILVKQTKVLGQTMEKE